MKNLILFVKIVALLSFLIGTVLLAIYLYFDYLNAISMFGFYFVIIAFIANAILLIVNIIAIIIDSNYRTELIKACAFMLLNIPIAILYFYIVISIEFPTKG